ncbi:MAG: cysteine desulfurase NifS [Clostridiales Family XIII bacterium]|jgi:cysteine desulfurase|nr:cysteine desulfurase NifS [Clostridiales Family XIII bacterium]
MKRQVYLDYSATTPVKDEVLQAMLPYFTQNFGNPSSLYTIGQESKQALEEARELVAALIGASPREIFFTSSGTEADNWAVIEAAESRAKKGRHIITTKIEHHALLHSCEYLEKRGFAVTYLDTDGEGFVDPALLERSLTDETTLVSIMFVNNEIGTIQPIEALARIAKERGALFHTDAVQAPGNVPIDVRALGVDLLSVSAHKIYGPKGVGALYIRKGVSLPNHIHGGGQENKKRAGTENLTGIIGFGKAAELSARDLDAHIERLTKLRNYFLERIRENIPDIRVNGSLARRLPGNLNITFQYIEGEALLLLLDLDGIAVSTGSACSSASLTPSHVLTALGVPVEMIHGSLRFTVGDFTTKDDIDYTVDCLVKNVEKLRNISSVSKEKGWLKNGNAV